MRTGASWRNLNVLSGRKLSALQAHSSELGWLRSLNFLAFDKALPIIDQSSMHARFCGNLGMFTMPASVSSIDVIFHNLQVKYHWSYLQIANSRSILLAQTK